MTREKAIKELEILKEDYWDDDGYGHETKQYDDTMLALEMAIKALEQEPCDDCVSRIEALNSLDKVENKDSWYRLTDVMKMIRNLPPVTPQPKTGHWISVGERLPEWGEEVLTINNDRNYEINHIIDDECNEWFYDNDIVAWMPLPPCFEPQKSEDYER